MRERVAPATPGGGVAERDASSRVYTVTVIDSSSTFPVTLPFTVP